MRTGTSKSVVLTVPLIRVWESQVLVTQGKDKLKNTPGEGACPSPGLVLRRLGFEAEPAVVTASGGEPLAAAEAKLGGHRAHRLHRG